MTRDSKQGRFDTARPVCYNLAIVPPGGIGASEVSEKGSGEMSEQQDLISDFVNRRVWAVVGASHRLDEAGQ